MKGTFGWLGCLTTHIHHSRALKRMKQTHGMMTHRVYTFIAVATELVNSKRPRIIAFEKTSAKKFMRTKKKKFPAPPPVLMELVGSVVIPSHPTTTTTTQQINKISSPKMKNGRHQPRRTHLDGLYIPNHQKITMEYSNALTES